MHTNHVLYPDLSILAGFVAWLLPLCCCCTADVHVQPNKHKELLEEVRAAAAHAALVREVHAVSDAAGAGDGDEDATISPIVAQLKHVDTDDKGKPAIDPDTHVQKVSWARFVCKASG